MERLSIVDKALAIPRFIGRQLVGGAWGELAEQLTAPAEEQPPLTGWHDERLAS